VEPEATGGSSDGNFTAAMGIPTIDGLGAIGANYHTVDEYIEIDQVETALDFQRRFLLAFE
jgi:glutamate carboxypeptidase